MKFRWIFLLFCLTGRAQLPDSLAAIFAYPKQADMKYLIDSSDVQQKVSVQKIRYTASGGFTVSAFLTAPEKSNAKHPLAVFGHWGEGDKSEFLNEATVLSTKGFICILPDGPWLCPDSPIRSFKRQGYEMYRQYVCNARAAIDLAQQNFTIDERYIFYVGHSFGCNAASVLSAVDARVDYFVFMAGAYSTVENVRNSKFPDFAAWRSEDPAQFEAWSKRMKNLDAHYYLPYKTVPCLIQLADRDAYISAAENEKFTQITPEPKLVKHYPTGHDLGQQAAIDRNRWILEKAGR